MASDISTCTLLRTLASSKRNARFLELGTGTGLSTSFILDGMDEKSTLVSLDNDAQYLSIARQYLGQDSRLLLVEMDGGIWIDENKTSRFDFIFADTWPGKYWQLEETLQTLNIGGFYIVDDMLPQSNWPEGHAEKVQSLTTELNNRPDFSIVKMDWASGIVIATKKY
ncbi:MAG: class I SAM-dependent methyltransferase [Chitinophagaceae bacterium]